MTKTSLDIVAKDRVQSDPDETSVSKATDDAGSTKWVDMALDGAVVQPGWQDYWSQLRARWHPVYLFGWMPAVDSYWNNDVQDYYVEEIPEVVEDVVAVTEEIGREITIEEHDVIPEPVPAYSTYTILHPVEYAPAAAYYESTSSVYGKYRSERKRKRCGGCCAWLPCCSWCTCCLILLGLLLVAAAAIPVLIHLLSPGGKDKDTVGRVPLDITLYNNGSFTEDVTNASSLQHAVIKKQFEREMKDLLANRSLGHYYDGSSIKSVNFGEDGVKVQYHLYFNLIKNSIPSKRQLRDILLSLERDENNKNLGILGDLRFYIDLVKFKDGTLVRKLQDEKYITKEKTMRVENDHKKKPVPRKLDRDKVTKGSSPATARQQTESVTQSVTIDPHISTLTDTEIRSTVTIKKEKELTTTQSVTSSPTISLDSSTVGSETDIEGLLDSTVALTDATATTEFEAQWYKDFETTTSIFQSTSHHALTSGVETDSPSTTADREKESTTITLTSTTISSTPIFETSGIDSVQNFYDKVFKWDIGRFLFFIVYDRAMKDTMVPNGIVEKLKTREMFYEFLIRYLDLQKKNNATTDDFEKFYVSYFANNDISDTDFARSIFNKAILEFYLLLNKKRELSTFVDRKTQVGESKQAHVELTESDKTGSNVRFLSGILNLTKSDSLYKDNNNVSNDRALNSILSAINSLLQTWTEDQHVRNADTILHGDKGNKVLLNDNQTYTDKLVRIHDIDLQKLSNLQDKLITNMISKNRSTESLETILASSVYFKLNTSVFLDSIQSNLKKDKLWTIFMTLYLTKTLLLEAGEDSSDKNNYLKLENYLLDTNSPRIARSRSTAASLLLLLNDISIDKAMDGSFPLENLTPEQLALMKLLYILTIIPTKDDDMLETGYVLLIADSATDGMLLRNITRALFELTIHKVTMSISDSIQRQHMLKILQLLQTWHVVQEAIPKVSKRYEIPKSDIPSDGLSIWKLMYILHLMQSKETTTKTTIKTTIDAIDTSAKLTTESSSSTRAVMESTIDTDTTLTYTITVAPNISSSLETGTSTVPRETTSMENVTPDIFEVTTQYMTETSNTTFEWWYAFETTTSSPFPEQSTTTPMDETKYPLPHVESTTAMAESDKMEKHVWLMRNIIRLLTLIANDNTLKHDLNYGDINIDKDYLEFLNAFLPVKYDVEFLNKVKQKSIYNDSTTESLDVPTLNFHTGNLLYVINLVNNGTLKDHDSLFKEMTTNKTDVELNETLARVGLNRLMLVLNRTISAKSALNKTADSETFSQEEGIDSFNFEDFLHILNVIRSWYSPNDNLVGDSKTTPDNTSEIQYPSDPWDLFKILHLMRTKSIDHIDSEHYTINPTQRRLLMNLYLISNILENELNALNTTPDVNDFENRKVQLLNLVHKVNTIPSKISLETYDFSSFNNISNLPIKRSRSFDELAHLFLILAHLYEDLPLLADTPLVFHKGIEDDIENVDNLAQRKNMKEILHLIRTVTLFRELPIGNRLMTRTDDADRHEMFWDMLYILHMFHNSRLAESKIKEFSKFTTTMENSSAYYFLNLTVQTTHLTTTVSDTTTSTTQHGVLSTKPEGEVLTTTEETEIWPESTVKMISDPIEPSKSSIETVTQSTAVDSDRFVESSTLPSTGFTEKPTTIEFKTLYATTESVKPPVSTVDYIESSQGDVIKSIIRDMMQLLQLIRNDDMFTKYLINDGHLSDANYNINFLDFLSGILSFNDADLKYRDLVSRHFLENPSMIEHAALKHPDKITGFNITEERFHFGNLIHVLKLMNNDTLYLNDSTVNLLDGMDATADELARNLRDAFRLFSNMTESEDVALDAFLDIGKTRHTIPKDTFKVETFLYILNLIRKFTSQNGSQENGAGMKVSDSLKDEQFDLWDLFYNYRHLKNGSFRELDLDSNRKRFSSKIYLTLDNLEQHIRLSNASVNLNNSKNLTSEQLELLKIILSLNLVPNKSRLDALNVSGVYVIPMTTLNKPRNLSDLAYLLVLIDLLPDKLRPTFSKQTVFNRDIDGTISLIEDQIQRENLQDILYIIRTLALFNDFQRNNSTGNTLTFMKNNYDRESSWDLFYTLYLTLNSRLAKEGKKERPTSTEEFLLFTEAIPSTTEFTILEEYTTVTIGDATYDESLTSTTSQISDNVPKSSTTQQATMQSSTITSTDIELPTLSTIIPTTTDYTTTATYKESTLSQLYNTSSPIYGTLMSSTTADSLTLNATQITHTISLSTATSLGPEKINESTIMMDMIHLLELVRNDPVVLEQLKKNDRPVKTSSTTKSQTFLDFVSNSLALTNNEEDFSKSFSRYLKKNRTRHEHASASVFNRSIGDSLNTTEEKIHFANLIYVINMVSNGTFFKNGNLFKGQDNNQSVLSMEEKAVGNKLLLKLTGILNMSLPAESAFYFLSGDERPSNATTSDPRTLERLLYILNLIRRETDHTDESNDFMNRSASRQINILDGIFDLQPIARVLKGKMSKKDISRESDVKLPESKQNHLLQNVYFLLNWLENESLDYTNATIQVDLFEHLTADHLRLLHLINKLSVIPNQTYLEKHILSGFNETNETFSQSPRNLRDLAYMAILLDSMHGSTFPLDLKQALYDNEIDNAVNSVDDIRKRKNVKDILYLLRAWSVFKDLQMDSDTGITLSSNNRGAGQFWDLLYILHLVQNMRKVDGMLTFMTTETYQETTTDDYVLTGFSEGYISTSPVAPISETTATTSGQENTNSKTSPYTERFKQITEDINELSTDVPMSTDWEVLGTETTDYSTSISAITDWDLLFTETTDYSTSVAVEADTKSTTPETTTFLDTLQTTFGNKSQLSKYTPVHNDTYHDNYTQDFERALMYLLQYIKHDDTLKTYMNYSRNVASLSNATSFLDFISGLFSLNGIGTLQREGINKYIHEIKLTHENETGSIFNRTIEDVLHGIETKLPFKNIMYVISLMLNGTVSQNNTLSKDFVGNQTDLSQGFNDSTRTNFDSLKHDKIDFEDLLYISHLTRYDLVQNKYPRDDTSSFNSNNETLLRESNMLLQLFGNNISRINKSDYFLNLTDNQITLLNELNNFNKFQQETYLNVTPFGSTKDIPLPKIDTRRKLKDMAHIFMIINKKLRKSYLLEDLKKGAFEEYIDDAILSIEDPVQRKTMHDTLEILRIWTILTDFNSRHFVENDTSDRGRQFVDFLYILHIWQNYGLAAKVQTTTKPPTSTIILEETIETLTTERGKTTTEPPTIMIIHEQTTTLSTEREQTTTEAPTSTVSVEETTTPHTTKREQTTTEPSTITSTDEVTTSLPTEREQTTIEPPTSTVLLEETTKILTTEPPTSTSTVEETTTIISTERVQTTTEPSTSTIFLEETTSTFVTEPSTRTSTVEETTTPITTEREQTTTEPPSSTNFLEETTTTLAIDPLTSTSNVDETTINFTTERERTTTEPSTSTVFLEETTATLTTEPPRSTTTVEEITTALTTEREQTTTEPPSNTFFLEEPTSTLKFEPLTRKSTVEETNTSFTTEREQTSTEPPSNTVFIEGTTLTFEPPTSTTTKPPTSTIILEETIETLSTERRKTTTEPPTIMIIHEQTTTLSTEREQTTTEPSTSTSTVEETTTLITTKKGQTTTEPPSNTFFLEETTTTLQFEPLTSTSTVEETTTSVTTEREQISTEPPSNTVFIEETTLTFEPPTSTSTVEETTTTTITEREQTTTEPPTSTVLLEETTKILTTEPPTSTSTVEETTTIISTEREQTTTEPSTSTIFLEETTSTLVTEPSTITSAVKETTSPITTEREETSTEPPSNTFLLEETTTTPTLEPPTSTSTVEETTTPITTEIEQTSTEPPSSTVFLEETTSTLVTEPSTSTSTVEETTTPFTTEREQTTTEASTSTSIVEETTTLTTTEREQTTTEPLLNTVFLDEITTSFTFESRMQTTTEPPTTIVFLDETTSTFITEPSTKTNTVEETTTPITTEREQTTTEPPTSTVFLEETTTTLTTKPPISTTTVEETTATPTTEREQTTTETPASTSPVEETTTFITTEREQTTAKPLSSTAFLEVTTSTEPLTRSTSMLFEQTSMPYNDFTTGNQSTKNVTTRYTPSSVTDPSQRNKTANIFENAVKRIRWIMDDETKKAQFHIYDNASVTMASRSYLNFLRRIFLLLNENDRILLQNISQYWGSNETKEDQTLPDYSVHGDPLSNLTDYGSNINSSLWNTFGEFEDHFDLGDLLYISQLTKHGIQWGDSRKHGIDRPTRPTEDHLTTNLKLVMEWFGNETHAMNKPNYFPNLQSLSAEHSALLNLIYYLNMIPERAVLKTSNFRSPSDIPMFPHKASRGLNELGYLLIVLNNLYDGRLMPNISQSSMFEQSVDDEIKLLEDAVQRKNLQDILYLIRAWTMLKQGNNTTSAADSGDGLSELFDLLYVLHLVQNWRFAQNDLESNVSQNVTIPYLHTTTIATEKVQQTAEPPVSTSLSIETTTSSSYDLTTESPSTDNATTYYTTSLTDVSQKNKTASILRNVINRIRLIIDDDTKKAQLQIYGNSTASVAANSFLNFMKSFLLLNDQDRNLLYNISQYKGDNSANMDKTVSVLLPGRIASLFNFTMDGIPFDNLIYAMDLMKNGTIYRDHAVHGDKASNFTDYDSDFNSSLWKDFGEFEDGLDLEDLLYISHLTKHGIQWGDSQEQGIDRPLRPRKDHLTTNIKLVMEWFVNKTQTMNISNSFPNLESLSAEHLALLNLIYYLNMIPERAVLKTSNFSSPSDIPMFPHKASRGLNELGYLLIVLNNLYDGRLMPNISQSSMFEQSVDDEIKLLEDAVQRKNLQDILYLIRAWTVLKQGNKNTSATDSGDGLSELFDLLYVLHLVQNWRFAKNDIESTVIQEITPYLHTSTIATQKVQPTTKPPESTSLDLETNTTSSYDLTTATPSTEDATTYYTTSITDESQRNKTESILRNVINRIRFIIDDDTKKAQLQIYGNSTASVAANSFLNFMKSFLLLNDQDRNLLYNISQYKGENSANMNKTLAVPRLGSIASLFNFTMNGIPFDNLIYVMDLVKNGTIYTDHTVHGDQASNLTDLNSDFNSSLWTAFGEFEDRFDLGDLLYISHLTKHGIQWGDSEEHGRDRLVSPTGDNLTTNLKLIIQWFGNNTYALNESHYFPYSQSLSSEHFELLKFIYYLNMIPERAILKTSNFSSPSDIPMAPLQTSRGLNELAYLLLILNNLHDRRLMPNIAPHSMFGQGIDDEIDLFENSVQRRNLQDILYLVRAWTVLREINDTSSAFDKGDDLSELFDLLYILHLVQNWRFTQNNLETQVSATESTTYTEETVSVTTVTITPPTSTLHTTLEFIEIITKDSTTSENSTITAEKSIITNSETSTMRTIEETTSTFSDTMTTPKGHTESKQTSTSSTTLDPDIKYLWHLSIDDLGKLFPEGVDIKQPDEDWNDHNFTDIDEDKSNRSSRTPQTPTTVSADQGHRQPFSGTDINNSSAIIGHPVVFNPLITETSSQGGHSSIINHLVKSVDNLTAEIIPPERLTDTSANVSRSRKQMDWIDIHKLSESNTLADDNNNMYNATELMNMFQSSLNHTSGLTKKEFFTFYNITGDDERLKKLQYVFNLFRFGTSLRNMTGGDLRNNLTVTDLNHLWNIAEQKFSNSTDKTHVRVNDKDLLYILRLLLNQAQMDKKSSNFERNGEGNIQPLLNDTMELDLLYKLYNNWLMGMRINMTDQDRQKPLVGTGGALMSHVDALSKNPINGMSLQRGVNSSNLNNMMTIWMVLSNVSIFDLMNDPNKFQSFLNAKNTWERGHIETNSGKSPQTSSPPTNQDINWILSIMQNKTSFPDIGRRGDDSRNQLNLWHNTLQNMSFAGSTRQRLSTDGHIPIAGMDDWKLIQLLKILSSPQNGTIDTSLLLRGISSNSSDILTQAQALLDHLNKLQRVKDDSINNTATDPADKSIIWSRADVIPVIGDAGKIANNRTASILVDKGVDIGATVGIVDLIKSRSVAEGREETSTATWGPKGPTTMPTPTGELHMYQGETDGSEIELSAENRVWGTVEANKPLTLKWELRHVTGWEEVHVERRFTDTGVVEHIGTVTADDHIPRGANGPLTISYKSRFGERHVSVVVAIAIFTCDDEASYNLNLTFTSGATMWRQDEIFVYGKAVARLISPPDIFEKDGLGGITCRAHLGYPERRMFFRVKYRSENSPVTIMVPPSVYNVTLPDPCEREVMASLEDVLEPGTSLHGAVVQCGLVAIPRPGPPPPQGNVVTSSPKLIRIIPDSVRRGSMGNIPESFSRFDFIWPELHENVPSDSVCRGAMGRVPHPFSQCDFVDCRYSMVMICPERTCFNPVLGYCRALPT